MKEQTVYIPIPQMVSNGTAYTGSITLIAKTGYLLTKDELDSLKVLCVEFGYKQAEKGNNIQKAISEFKNLNEPTQ